MTGLRGLLDKARSWLGSVPTPALEEQAVRQTLFDSALFAELRTEAPVLNDLIGSLNRDYGYTEELVADTFAQMYQSAPLIRGRAEMAEPCLLNHAVATNLSKAPDVTALRGYSQHDKYAATMATIGVSNRVREFLAENKELQEAAEQAEQERQEARRQEQQVQQQLAEAQAAQDTLDQQQADLDDAGAALAAAQAAAAAAMGDYDGNGPLTPEQAAAQEAALDAAVAQAEAQGACDQGAAEAQVTAEQLAQLLEQAEAARAAAEAAGEAVQDVADRSERALRGPVAEAVTEAVDALTEEAALFRAWGFDDGDLERMSFEERAEKARRLRNHAMKDYVAELGRWKMMQKAQYARHVADARDEVYDVTLGGHLPDVLPAEFAHLGTEPGRIDFMVRLSERQLLSRKYRGTERIGQGAIVCLVDTSTSMKQKDKSGTPREVFAKGFALAMLDQARAEKRDFVGIIFANAAHQQVWHFPAGKGEFDDVLDFAELFFGGGTDFQVPLDLGMDILDEQFSQEGKAQGDLVLITDDDCAVSAQWLAAYAERKARLNFRTFGVAVGMPRAGGTLTSLSDDVRGVLEFHDPMVVSDIVRAV